MTRNETIRILRKFKSAYRNFYKDLTESEAKDMIGLWQMMFVDIDCELIELSLIKLIATKKEFPPSIAEILETAAEIKHGEQLTAGQAWQETITAMRNHGIYKANKGIKTLSTITLRVINQMGGFSRLCRSETPEIDCAHFFKIFDELMKQEKEKMKLPKHLRLVLETGYADSNLLAANYHRGEKHEV